MREKLVELVKRAITDWEHGDVSERIADHLIANGVIVPPCKIGDDIWWIDGSKKTVECEKHGVAGFIITKMGIRIMDSCGGEDRIGTQYCHLTQEAAEKALKEGAYSG